jgi:hypothetical protein
MDIRWGGGEYGDSRESTPGAPRPKVEPYRVVVGMPPCATQRISSPMSERVGWDRGADRASNDADVSSILPIIPYGGFSQYGWKAGISGGTFPKRLSA